MTNLQDMRREYLNSSLRRHQLQASPFDQFTTWFDKTLADEGQIDASCMQLATVSDEGQPRTRIVLLKGYSEQGFVFFTSYNSRKGTDIKGNPKVGLSFAWNQQERQIHIEGTAEAISDEESDEYFASRPIDSQRAALLAQQSSIIAGKTDLLDRFGELQSQSTITRPTTWGGYRVVPNRFEFWQGGAARIHDRFAYTNVDGSWQIDRLAP